MSEIVLKRFQFRYAFGIFHWNYCLNCAILFYINTVNKEDILLFKVRHALFFTVILSFLSLSNVYARDGLRSQEGPDSQQESALPQLDQKQMYQDFDFLISSITNTFCRIQLKKALMGQDIEADLQALRKKIREISTYREFLLLVNQALIVTQDMHNFILKVGMYNWDRLDIEDPDSTYARLSRKYYDLLPSYNLELPFIYFQGEYRVFSGFTAGNTQVNTGDTLISIEGTPVHEYVRELRWERYLMWDQKNKRFYDDQFYLCDSFMKHKQLTLEFKDTKGRKKKLVLDTDRGLSFSTPHYFSARETYDPRNGERRIKYLEKYKTLYIRALSLNRQQKIIKSLLKYKDKDIRAIVFDFRDSPGGYTDFFPSLLQHIYPDPIHINMTVGMKVINLMFEGHDNPRIKKGLQSLSLTGTVPVPVLNNEQFQRFTYELHYDALQENLEYTGKVYLLLNEHTFSSPTVAQYQALHLDRVVTVGQPSGYEQGEARGGFYELFILPHSRIAYQIVNVIDLSTYDTIEELFDNRVELPVEPTWEETLSRMYYEGDVYGTEFLLKQDPLMKKVFKQPRD